MAARTSISWLVCFFAATLCLSVACVKGAPGDSEGDGGEFERPTEFDIPNRPFNSIDLFEETESYSTEAFNPGEVSLLKGRKHMDPDDDHQQFWLKTDEPLVIDITYKMWGFDLDNYDIVVLANFQPVDFYAQTVEPNENFPSVDRLERTTSGSSNCFPIEFTQKETKGVTIHIPESSFPGKGAYDIRILLMPKNEPSAEKRVVMRGGSTIHHAVTLYRGGVEFPREMFDDLKDTEIESRSIGSKLAIGQTSPTSAFLLPPKTIYDLDTLDSPFNDARLGQAFTVTDKEVSLHGLTFQSSHLKEKRSMMMVFDGCNPLATPKGIVTPPERPDDPLNTRKDFVVRFPVDIEMSPKEMRKIRLVKMVSPFEDMLELSGPSPIKTDISNTIFLTKD